MNKLKSYQGSTALITGASSGIGKGFAEKLASYGINLIITARSEKVLNDLSIELKTTHGIEVDVIALDLSENNASKILFDYIQDHNKSIDILINNAGFGKWAHFINEPLHNYQQMLMLNIKSLVDLTYLCLPMMLENKKGIIINVASTAAFQPLPYIAVYGASKSFVLNFTEALSGEYSNSGISFLALCPGNTATNFAQVAQADTKDMSVSTVEEVVEAANNAIDRKKTYCIPGTGNYFLAQLSRIMPRPSMVNIAKNMLKNRIK